MLVVFACFLLTLILFVANAWITGRLAYYLFVNQTSGVTAWGFFWVWRRWWFGRVMALKIRGAGESYVTVYVSLRGVSAGDMIRVLLRQDHVHVLFSVWVPQDSDRFWLDHQVTAHPAYSRLTGGRAGAFVSITPRGWLSVLESLPSPSDLSRIALALNDLAFHLAGTKPAMREPLREAEVLRERPVLYTKLFWQTSVGIVIAFGAAMLSLITYARR